MSVGKSIGSTVSLFTYAREDNFDQHVLDCELTHLVNDNIEIGTRLGFGLNKQSPEFSVNLGGGFRF